MRTRNNKQYDVMVLIDGVWHLDTMPLRSSDVAPVCNPTCVVWSKTLEISYIILEKLCAECKKLV